MKKKLMCLLVFALTIIMITGCSKSNDSKEKLSKNKEVSENNLKTIGIKDDDSYEFNLTNSTGKDIIGISIKSSDEENYPENMLESNDRFKKDETRVIYYNPEELLKDVKSDNNDNNNSDNNDNNNKEDNASSTEKKDNVDNVEINIQLEFEDNKIEELHFLPIENIKDGRVEIKDEIVYLVYNKKDSEEEISTYEEELDVKNKEAEAAAKAEAEAEAEAAAQAEAEAAAQAEAEAAAQAEAEAAAQAEAEAAAQAEAEAAAQAEAEAAAQAEAEAKAQAQSDTQAVDQSASDDACIDDGLFY